MLLRLHPGRRKKEYITPAKSRKLGEGITGKVLETGKSIIFEDIEGGGSGELKPL